MNKEFSSLRAFAAHMDELRKRERMANTVARGAVAKDLTVEVQRRIGKYQPGWQRLAPSTLARRRAMGYTAETPLLMTGEYQRSWSWGHTGTGETGVGSSSPLAPYHELGGRVDGHPPRRSVLMEASRDKDVALFLVYCQIYREALGF